MESIQHTNLGIEANITSLPGMKTILDNYTELCRQKCRRIQASRHTRAGILIYTAGDWVGASTIWDDDCNTVQCQCDQLQNSRLNS